MLTSETRKKAFIKGSWNNRVKKMKELQEIVKKIQQLVYRQ